MKQKKEIHHVISRPSSPPPSPSFTLSLPLSILSTGRGLGIHGTKKYIEESWCKTKSQGIAGFWAQPNLNQSKEKFVWWRKTERERAKQRDIERRVSWCVGRFGFCVSKKFDLKKYDDDDLRLLLLKTDDMCVWTNVNKLKECAIPLLVSFYMCVCVWVLGGADFFMYGPSTGHSLRHLSMWICADDSLYSSRRARALYHHHHRPYPRKKRPTRKTTPCGYIYRLYRLSDPSDFELSVSTRVLFTHPVTSPSLTSHNLSSTNLSAVSS